MSKTDSNTVEQILKLDGLGYTSREIAEQVLGRKSAKSTVGDILRKHKEQPKAEVNFTPNIITLDIETAPLTGAVWSLWKQNVGLNQIVKDWFILSYSAKWFGTSEEDVLYNDLRGCVKEEDDTQLLEELWQILDKADIVITQNGVKFDTKKINARFVLKGFQPPSSYKQIDTLLIAKSAFGFTSNKLEYMTDKLCTKYKKLPHGKFPGFTLWKECLADNEEAWDEMALYNKYDVLSLEELYVILAPWDKKHPNFNLYRDDLEVVCRCGSTDLVKNGYAYTSVSKFQKYRCKDCGTEVRDRINLFSKEKRDTLTMNVI